MNYFLIGVWLGGLIQQLSGAILLNDFGWKAIVWGAIWPITIPLGAWKLERENRKMAVSFPTILPCKHDTGDRYCDREYGTVFCGNCHAIVKEGKLQ